MTKGKIALAALDPSTQLLGFFLQGEQAESWCRIYNECVKEFLKKYPERFTAMAAVPIQEPARAAKIMEHAVIQLGFRGAYIATNVNHQSYDSEDFDPFSAKAEELDVLVFMHPGQSSRNGVDGLIRPALGTCCNPADTTLSLGTNFWVRRQACWGPGVPDLITSAASNREYLTGKQATRRADRCQLATFCVHAYLKNLYFDTLGLRPGNS